MHLVYKYRLKETLFKIYWALLKKHELNIINQYIFIGEIIVDNVHVFTHFKLLIQDEINVLVSTSNICDRSLAHGRSDKEFGVMIYNQKNSAKLLLQKIYQYFIKDNNNIPVVFDDFYEEVLHNMTYIKPIRLKNYSIKAR